MAFNISYVFEAIDKFTAVSRKISRSIESLSKKMTKFQQKIKGAGKSMMDLGKKMMLRVTAPLIGIGIMAIKSASNLEDMNVAFEAMLHSSTKAKKMVQSLIEFTARTPFRLPEVQASAQQLLAFGFETKQIIPILKELGDMAAINKIPLSGLASVFGKIHSRGHATARELRQLVIMRIPIVKTLKEMAAKAGYAGEDVWDLAAKGQATEKVMNDAFKSMTTGAGIFANGAEKMAHSLSGLFSTLRDNIDLVLGRIGMWMVDTLELKKKTAALIAYFNKLRPQLKVFGKTHKTLIKIVIAFALILAALAPILITVGMLVFTFGILLNPITLIITGVIAIGAALTYLYTISETFRNVVLAIGDGFKFLWSVIKWIIAISEPFFALWSDLQNFTLKALIDSFKFISHLITFGMVQPLLKVINIGKKIASLFFHKKVGVDLKKPGMLEQAQPFARQQSFASLALPQQRVRSDVNIALHDPGNFVKRLYGKTEGDGNLGFNLGTNMLASYM